MASPPFAARAGRPAAAARGLGNVLHTVRFRLTVLNLVVFGVITAVAFVAITALRERQLRDDFDQWLSADATRMVEQIVAQSGSKPLIAPAEGKPQINPFHFRGYYFQLRLVDGVTLVKSANLQAADLPLSAAARAASASREPVLEVIEGDLLRRLPRAQGPVRLLTLYSPEPAGSPFYLQVGARLDRMEGNIRGLRWLMAFLFPITLVPVAAGSWYMAGRALRPIDEITAAARQMTVDRLGQRLGPVVPRGDLSEMIESLNQMLERIEKGFRSQERFAAEVSHELKTPISILLTEAQVLSRSPRATEEYDQFVASVEAEMQRLARTVDSLLLLARANAGLPVPLAAEVSLNDVVTEAVRRCAPLAAHWEVQVVLMLSEAGADEPEPLVQGDEELLCAMTTNLIHNAIRHSGAGKRVEVDLSVGPAQATLAVRDQGPGIPQHVGDDVFRPFVSLSPDNGADGGSGLGLTIARSIADLHGGSIRLANRPAGGAEAVVVLPVVQDA